MNIQLIKGHFDAREAMDLITQMIHVKIKYQEDRIQRDSHEEDVKMHEQRIKELQKDLFELRKHIESKSGPIDMAATIEIL